MSNGTNNISTFEKLLQRFRFKQLLPDEVKKFILQYEREALVTTLKVFNEYNFIYGFVTRIFFLSYKFNLRFSIKQSKLILGIASLLTAGILSASIIYSTKFIKIGESVLPGIQLPTQNKMIKNETIEVKKSAIKDTEIKNIYVKYRLGVNLFSAKNIENSQSQLVTDTISKKLAQKLGQNNVIDLSKNQKGLSFNRILSGSVAGLGKKVIISVKVIDIQDSKVIFGTTETLGSINEIDAKCTDITKMIVDKIEWK